MIALVHLFLHLLDTPMLQDLDQLANRISRLVSYSERLKTERSELLSRVKLLEQERTTLRDQFSTQQTEHASMSEIVTRHQQQVEEVKREAEASQESLYADLLQQQDEMTRLNTRLQRAESKAVLLEQAALAARDQVESVLQRLPISGQAVQHFTHAQD